MDIISTLLAFISGGGLIGVLTLRQTKESKSLDNAAKLVGEYKDLLDRYKEKSVQQEDQIIDLQKEVNDLKLKVSGLAQQLHTANLLVKAAELMKCENLSCSKRVPKLKGDELSEITEETENADN
nr:MAG TPA: hypothetical protein [Caudoviricetes sp.]